MSKICPNSHDTDNNIESHFVKIRNKVFFCFSLFIPPQSDFHDDDNLRLEISKRMNELSNPAHDLFLLLIGQ